MSEVHLLLSKNFIKNSAFVPASSLDCSNIKVTSYHHNFMFPRSANTITLVSHQRKHSCGVQKIIWMIWFDCFTLIQNSSVFSIHSFLIQSPSLQDWRIKFPHTWHPDLAADTLCDCSTAVVWCCRSASCDAKLSDCSCLAVDEKFALDL